jgi:hypothetical protein
MHTNFLPQNFREMDEHLGTDGIENTVPLLLFTGRCLVTAVL